MITRLSDNFLIVLDELFTTCGFLFVSSMQATLNSNNKTTLNNAISYKLMNFILDLLEIFGNVW